ncbi:hypothetical protein PINS_up002181 [Pythium insidiosum]|nr:hypothetical protein PINS_up002181 [Pythium insidiosum]
MTSRESVESVASDDGTKRTSAVQVAVRVRPLSAGESAQGSEPCVTVVGPRTVLLGGVDGKQYEVDAALAPSTPQHDVYSTLVMPLVDRFFDGYNATVLAYGQTGSGKTYVRCWYSHVLGGIEVTIQSFALFADTQWGTSSS